MLIQITYVKHFNRRTAAATRWKRRSCESRITSARHWTENAKLHLSGAFDKIDYEFLMTGTHIGHHKLVACVAAVVHQRTPSDSHREQRHVD